MNAKQTGEKASKGHDFLIETLLSKLIQFKQTGDKAGEGKTYGNLGFRYHFLGHCDKAVQCHEMSLSIAKQIGDKAGEGRAYNNLGNCYHSLGQYDKAVQYHEMDLSIAKQIGDKAGEGQTYGNLGVCYDSLGQYDKAVQFHEMRLTIAKQIGDKFGEIIGYLNLGSRLFYKKQYDQAALNLNKCLSSVEFVSSNVPRQDAFRISFRNTDHINLSHRFLVRTLVAQDKTDDALVIEERLRSRALVELMLTSYSVLCTQTTATKLNDIHEIFDVVKALGCSVLYLSFDENNNEVLMWFVQLCGTVVFKRSKEVAKQDLDCLTSKTRRIPGTLTYEDRSLSFLHPEPELKPDVKDRNVAVLDNKTAEEETVANETSSSSRLNVEKREAVSAAPTTANITSATICSPSKFKDYFKKLYQIIFGPVRDFIEETEQVVVVPDRELYLVPFSALQDNEGRYVAEYLKVRVVPSLTTAQMITMRSKTSDSGESPLIIGNPDVGKPDMRLPCAEKEATMIGRLLGVQPLTGREATKEKVLQRLENSNLIHIAAHGDMKYGDILLAPPNNAVSRKRKESVLNMSDLEEKCVKSKLVVLSCCHSGRGEVTAEGVIGIARAFLGAGAGAVLMALWALHDEATMFFMESFYQHLSCGKKANESLHEAMKTMREKQEFNDPIFWAPFVLMGDDVTVFESS